jgi:hypothetical protein
VQSQPQQTVPVMVPLQNVRPSPQYSPKIGMLNMIFVS